MAESFLFSIVGRVLGQLASPALQEAKLIYFVPSELEKLTATLTTIQAVLLDAEEQQAKTHGAAEHQEMKNQLSDWLRKLKDVVYQIDDVLDDFKIVALRRQVMHRSIKRKVCNFFSSSNPLVFRIKMGHKIKDVRERLDGIAGDRHKFNLRVQPVDNRVVHTGRQTTDSFMDSDVFGREQYVEDVVEFLTSSSGQENISIISITGIGGIGKTTLAKLVFNDRRTKLHFQKRLWVCVSNEFDVEKIKIKITESAMGGNCSTMDSESLQNCLRGALDNKRYLLILDDVWNDDRRRWMDLLELLMGGANGSKILVTTRHDSVARVVGSKVTQKLGSLPHEKCMSIFFKHAFNAGEAAQHQNLVEIGKEIVKKCKGNPLAVKTLGSSLYNKHDVGDWLYVQDNEIWELPQEEGGVLCELKLSYDQLPSYLKPCFAFFSVFPKDYELHSNHLTYYWIAHGLIQSSDQNQELEDVGRKYIEELWSRSLIQEVDDYGFCLRFKIHDHVHDLAMFVAKTEYTVLNSSCAQSSSNSTIPIKVRHASFSNIKPWREEIPSWLRQQRDLRTIFFQYAGVGPTSKSFVKGCISSFKHLWYLDLSHSSFEALPSSMGSLKHLRFLRLSNNTEIKSLPNSICKLQSLEILRLEGCVKLKKLPRDIGNLISLKYLSITTQERCLPEKGIASLTSLRFLSIQDSENLEFLISDDGLQPLSALRTLSIINCKNLVSLPTKGMRYLTALETLLISNCEKLDLTMEEEEDIQFQDGGLRSLQTIWICEIPKLVAMPTWLLQGATALWQLIIIGECPNFKTLMADSLLQNLTSLQRLVIEKCPQLTSLPEGMRSLTMLQVIRISECPELVKSCQEGDDRYKIAHVPNIFLDGFKFKI